jgi:methoxymalonate biosynthesis acyl carrier protein
VTIDQYAPVSTDRRATTCDVQELLLSYLAERTGTAWQPTVDLFASGAVSSLFAMQLVVHLEQTFGVALDGEDLTLANFQSVRAMARLVHRLRGAGCEVCGG